MKHVDVDGMPFALLDEGAGDALVFLHGFPLNSAMWRAQLEEFATTHRVIAPDLRGHGQTYVTEGVVQMRELADDVAQLLDALQVNSAVTLCGLSMGGYVAWEFWRRHRERLARLILMDTRAAADTPEVARARHMMADQVIEAGAALAADSMIPKLFSPQTYETHPQLVESVRQIILATDPRAIAATQRGMAARADMTEMLADIDVPALLVCGSHDSITPPTEMQQMAASLPHGRYVEIPGAGHLAPLERPREVNLAIRDFLAQ